MCLASCCLSPTNRKPVFLPAEDTEKQILGHQSRTAMAFCCRWPCPAFARKSSCLIVIYSRGSPCLIGKQNIIITLHSRFCYKGDFVLSVPLIPPVVVNLNPTLSIGQNWTTCPQTLHFPRTFSFTTRKLKKKHSFCIMLICQFFLGSSYKLFRIFCI